MNGEASSSSRTLLLSSDLPVINCSTPHNSSFGRNWLHRMKDVSSTYHLLLRYPALGGVKEIKGDRAATR
ncbi:hypothetical protein EV2_023791 [Malus domestica]